MKRLSQHENETAMEYLRRVVSSLDYETGDVLDRLPSVEAVLDYFDLFLHTYGTEFWDGILEGIAEGEDPQPARDFIAKHSLPAWWTECVEHAIWRAAERPICLPELDA